jgi:hypothetical protein|tara:strand:- start:131 stop:523 length:393 start_codon:yes stop_codon:yes gene_type:complete
MNEIKVRCGNRSAHEAIVKTKEELKSYLSSAPDNLSTELWFEVSGPSRSRWLKLWYQETPSCWWTLLVERYQGALEDEDFYESLKPKGYHKTYMTADDIMSQPVENLNALARRWRMTVENAGLDVARKLF